MRTQNTESRIQIDKTGFLFPLWLGRFLPIILCSGFCVLLSSWRFQPTLLPFFQHKLVSGGVVVGNFAFQDSFLDGIFDYTHWLWWTYAEGFHDHFTRNGWLPVADAVCFFYFLATLPYQFKILQVTLYFKAVLGSNVRFAKLHQVVKIFACIKQQTANGRIGNIFFR